MQVGDLVSVKTKHCGTKLGVLVGHESLYTGHWRVKMLDHPRDVYAAPCDLEVISAHR